MDRSLDSIAFDLKPICSVTLNQRCVRVRSIHGLDRIGYRVGRRFLRNLAFLGGVTFLQASLNLVDDKAGRVGRFGSGQHGCY